MTEASDAHKKLVFVVLEDNFYPIRSIMEWAERKPIKYTDLLEIDPEELIRQYGQGVLHGTLVVIQQLLKDLGSDTSRTEILALTVTLGDPTLKSVIKEIHAVTTKLKPTHKFIVTLCHAYHGGRHDGREEIDQELNTLAGGDNVMVFAAAGNNGKVPAHQMCEVSNKTVEVPPKVFLPGFYPDCHNYVTVEVHWTASKPANGVLLCQARQRETSGVPAKVPLEDMHAPQARAASALAVSTTTGPTTDFGHSTGFSTIRWHPKDAADARKGIDISLLWYTDNLDSESVTVHMWVWSTYLETKSPQSPAHHGTMDRARFEVSPSPTLNKYQLGKVAAAHAVVSVGCKTCATHRDSDAGFLQTHTGPLPWPCKHHKFAHMQPDVFTDGVHYLLDPQFAASSWAVVHLAAAVGKAWLRNPTMTGPGFIESERKLNWKPFHDINHNQEYLYCSVEDAPENE